MYCLCQHCVMGPQKTVWANTGWIFSVTVHGWLGYSTLDSANKYLGYRPCWNSSRYQPTYGIESISGVEEPMGVDSVTSSNFVKLIMIISRQDLLFILKHSRSMPARREQQWVATKCWIPPYRTTEYHYL